MLRKHFQIVQLEAGDLPLFRNHVNPFGIRIQLPGHQWGIIRVSELKKRSRRKGRPIVGNCRPPENLEYLIAHQHLELNVRRDWKLFRNSSHREFNRIPTSNSDGENLTDGILFTKKPNTCTFTEQDLIIVPQSSVCSSEERESEHLQEFRIHEARKTSQVFVSVHDLYRGLRNSYNPLDLWRRFLYRRAQRSWRMTPQLRAVFFNRPLMNEKNLVCVFVEIIFSEYCRDKQECHQTHADGEREAKHIY